MANQTHVFSNFDSKIMKLSLSLSLYIYIYSFSHSLFTYNRAYVLCVYISGPKEDWDHQKGFDVSEFRLCFTSCLFIILLVQFGLLNGHLLGNSCPLG